MTDGEQSLPAAELLRRIAGAPFSGPMLDVDAARATLVTDLEQSELPMVTALLERVYGQGAPSEATYDPNVREASFEPLPESENWRSAQRLHEIIGFLRSPDGCPWDRAQDWSSLAPKVLEEAYEVVDAIRSGAPQELAGELGDLLLIVALLTQIAEEQGAFQIEDVYELVNRKLIRRHPHVFGDDAAATPEAVLSTWQRVKREERGDDAPPRSTFDRLPKSMPAIAKASIMFDDQTTPAPAGDLPDGPQLLEIVESMLAAGRDPEAELQTALEMKYTTS